MSLIPKMLAVMLRRAAAARAGAADPARLHAAHLRAAHDLRAVAELAMPLFAPGTLEALRPVPRAHERARPARRRSSATATGFAGYKVGADRRRCRSSLYGAHGAPLARRRRAARVRRAWRCARSLIGSCARASRCTRVLLARARRRRARSATRWASTWRAHGRSGDAASTRRSSRRSTRACSCSACWRSTGTTCSCARWRSRSSARRSARSRFERGLVVASRERLFTRDVRGRASPSPRR